MAQPRSVKPHKIFLFRLSPSAPVQSRGREAKMVEKVWDYRYPPHRAISELSCNGLTQGSRYFWVIGFVCFVLEFAFPHISPPLPYGVQISKQNMHGTYPPINKFTPIICQRASSSAEQSIRIGCCNLI